MSKTAKAMQKQGLKQGASLSKSIARRAQRWRKRAQRQKREQGEKQLEDRQRWDQLRDVLDGVLVFKEGASGGADGRTTTCKAMTLAEWLPNVSIAWFGASARCCVLGTCTFSVSKFIDFRTYV